MSLPSLARVALLLLGFFGLLFLGQELYKRRSYRYTILQNIGLSPLKTSLPMEQKLERRRLGTRDSLKDICPSDGLLLVNFWATWCAPCIAELPSMEGFYRQIKRGGINVEVVAVSVDRWMRDVERLVENLDFTIEVPILLDPDSAFSKSVGTTKFPETYLVDSSGKVAHHWIGPQDWLSGDFQDIIIKHLKNGKNIGSGYLSENPR